MNHTKGLLKLADPIKGISMFILDERGKAISSASESEDARRLVACWNACDGLPQDALDGGWTASGISQYAKRLEKERDELLDALRELAHGEYTNELGNRVVAILTKYPKVES